MYASGNLSEKEEYKNGIYGFWVKELPNAWDKPVDKKIEYIKKFILVDLKNETVNTLESYTYIKNSPEIQTKMNKKDDFEKVVPKTSQYYYYNFAQELDKEIPWRYKIRLKGYF